MRGQLIRAWLGPGQRAGFHRCLGTLSRLSEQLGFLAWVAQPAMQLVVGRIVHLEEGEKNKSAVLDSF